MIQPNHHKLLLGAAAVADFEQTKIKAVRGTSTTSSLLEQMLGDPRRQAGRRKPWTTDTASSSRTSLARWISHSWRITWRRPPVDGRRVSATRRNSRFLYAKDGAVVAGASGAMWGGGCQLHVVWVDETQRNVGVGRALMAEVASVKRRLRGCRLVMGLTYDVLIGDF